MGNALAIPNIDSSLGPTVIHQTPPHIKFEHIGEGSQWELTDRIEDTEGARGRIANALKEPEYDMFANNCEHFANYVAHDNRVSGQVITGVGVGVALGLLLLKLLKRK